MSEETEGRRRNDASIRMEQKFQDFLERYEANENKAEEWRDKFESRLILIEAFLSRLKIPGRISLWFLVAILTGMLAEAGRMLWYYVRHHVR